MQAVRYCCLVGGFPAACCSLPLLYTKVLFGELLSGAHHFHVNSSALQSFACIVSCSCCCTRAQVVLLMTP